MLPKINTASIIITGWSLTVSENIIGTKRFPSNACSNKYKLINIVNCVPNPNCIRPTTTTGIVTKNAPTYGIITDKPTSTDNNAEYLKPNDEKIIAAAMPTINISIVLPLT